MPNNWSGHTLTTCFSPVLDLPYIWGGERKWCLCIARVMEQSDCSIRVDYNPGMEGRMLSLIRHKKLAKWSVLEEHTEEVAIS